jgi:tetratricopeptide (TPR) repeat protein
MKSILLLPAFCAALAFSVTAYGQTKGSTTQPYNQSQGPAATSDVGKNANWDQLAQQARPGDYLAGKVILEGAPLAWEPIPVVVTCEEKPRYTAHTDATNAFRIVSADTTAKKPVSASAQKAVISQYVGCQVRAQLAGFQSSTITIPNRNLTDNPDIGTLTLVKEEGARGTAASNTSQSAPKDAAKQFEKARTEVLDGKPDRAQHDLEKAVQIYPQYAEAWYQLGRIQETSNPQAAQNSFQKATAADANYLPPYEHLAALAAQQKKYAELLDYTSHALQLDPRGTPKLWYYNAMANVNLGHPDVAKTSAEKGLAMDPLHTEPNTEQLLAVVLVSQKDYAGALEHLRSCLTYYPAGPNADVVRQQIAQLEQALSAAK